MRAFPALAVTAAIALLFTGCGGESDALESLAGTPAAIHIVKDVEAMARACRRPSKKTRQAGVKAYTSLAEITAVHPNATFGPEEGAEVTMRQLLRRSVEKTGRCIGVGVDARGRFQVE